MLTGRITLLLLCAKMVPSPESAYWWDNLVRIVWKDFPSPESAYWWDNLACIVWKDGHD